jgi:hypothetical protein
VVRPEQVKQRLLLTPVDVAETEEAPAQERLEEASPKVVIPLDSLVDQARPGAVPVKVTAEFEEPIREMAKFDETAGRKVIEESLAITRKEMETPRIEDGAGRPLMPGTDL